MAELIQLSLSDLPLLDEFLKHAGKSLETFRYYQKRPKEILGNHLVTLLLMENHEPVCYGHLDPEDGKVWLGIAVSEAQQGKGYGTLMMQALMDHAKKLSVPEISLSVDIDNRIAMKLYEAFGFKETLVTGRYKIYTYSAG